MKSSKGLGYKLGYSIEVLEKVSNEVESYYYPFEKKIYKRNGKIKVRNIEPTKGILNEIQVRIKDNILTPLIETNELSKYLYGGIKGKSNIKNAKVHQGKKFHFCTDLKDFFPSISNKRVYNMFIESGFSNKNANLLTKLTTINNHLPQGTPTSTHLSNLVFMNVDKELVDVCIEQNIVYTRFVDDLTFSSEKDFKQLSFIFLEIVKNNYYLYSHKKTFYSDKPVEITGIVVKQNETDVTNSYKSKDLNKLSEQAKQAHFSYMKRAQK